MKSNKIETVEEKQIIDDIESGNFTSLKENDLTSMKEQLISAAKTTIKKRSTRKAISIRLLEDDIDRLKALALKEGMPYQTYITHMIHKLSTGQLKNVS